MISPEDLIRIVIFQYSSIGFTLVIVSYEMLDEMFNCSFNKWTLLKNTRRSNQGRTWEFGGLVQIYKLAFLILTLHENTYGREKITVNKCLYK